MLYYKIFEQVSGSRGSPPTEPTTRSRPYKPSFGGPLFPPPTPKKNSAGASVYNNIQQKSEMWKCARLKDLVYECSQFNYISKENETS